MSAFENVNQMVIDAVMTDIAEHLLQEWINTNLDEGQYYSDQQIAIMSNDEVMRKAFNEHYKLDPTDEDYLEC